VSGKTNVIHLKPFDAGLAGNDKSNAALNNANGALSMPGLISRDNSSLYAPSSKIIPELLDINAMSKGLGAGREGGLDLVEFDNLLKIKQLNPLNHNTNNSMPTNLKPLALFLFVFYKVVLVVGQTRPDLFWSLNV
jgi:hypothetical protein